MTWLPPIFAFLVAAAGWFYVMHAGRAERLAHLEEETDNRRRIKLRRLGGMMMIALAVAFYVGYILSERDGNQILVVVCMFTVVLLLPAILFLGWVDLRLTRKMQESIKRNRR